MRTVVGDHGHQRDPAELKDEPAKYEAIDADLEVHGEKFGGSVVSGVVNLAETEVF